MVEYAAEASREYCLEVRRESAWRAFRAGDIGEAEYRSRMSRIEGLGNDGVRGKPAPELSEADELMILAAKRRLMEVSR